MNQRLIWVLTAALFGLVSASSALAAKAKPNIILIYTDDQGYGDVSALNPGSRFKTPNIDRLVREGLTFRDGHSSDTVCTPSRYGLLTGRYSWRTRLKSGVMGAEGKCLIEPERMTLGSFLKAKGYRTAMVGKWHLGMVFEGEKGKRDWSKPVIDGPHARGFDYFYGIPASMNYGILAYFENDRVTVPPTLWTSKKPGDNRPDPASYRMMPPVEEQQGTNATLEVAPDFLDSDVLERFLDEAVTFVKDSARESKQGTPFFLYLSLTSPHKPVCPQEQFIGKSDAGHYGDFMIETDYRVGQLLRILDELELWRDTMVIFTSDNGPESTYQDRVQQFGHRSAGGFRGGKRDIYEGGHRVPFIIRWPAVIKPGIECDEPVSQTDFLATFSDILESELPPDAGEDSFSLLPAFLGEDYPVPLRGPLIHHSSRGHFAIREGDWKLNLLRGSGGSLKPVIADVGPEDPPFELYNLRQNPSETSNLYEEYPHIAGRLKRRINEIIDSGGTRPGVVTKNDVPWWKQLSWKDEPADIE
jgi:arylsulfatase A